MKKLLSLFVVFALLICCRGHLDPDDPDAKLVTDYFVGYWWEVDIDAFGYNTCFILKEEDDTTFTKHPIFLKKSANEGKELFGTWNFEPPNTFYIYEERLPCMHTCSQYDYNCSICLMIEYYNPVANKSIDHIIVFESVMERINELVISKLNKLWHKNLKI